MRSTTRCLLRPPPPLSRSPPSLSLSLTAAVRAPLLQVVVNEEGNGYDSDVAARVKDGMRERCLPQIVDAWLTILRMHESAPSLAAACLQTVSLYVPWIPIGLVANASWLGLLTPFLLRPPLHEGACAVLMEVVLKRMDAAPKLEHLQSVRIVPTLAEGVQQGITITTKLAALVRATPAMAIHTPVVTVTHVPARAPLAALSRPSLAALSRGPLSRPS